MKRDYFAWQALSIFCFGLASVLYLSSVFEQWSSRVEAGSGRYLQVSSSSTQPTLPFHRVIVGHSFQSQIFQFESIDVSSFSDPVLFIGKYVGELEVEVDGRPISQNSEIPAADRINVARAAIFNLSGLNNLTSMSVKISVAPGERAFVHLGTAMYGEQDDFNDTINTRDLLYKKVALLVAGGISAVLFYSVFGVVDKRSRRYYLPIAYVFSVLAIFSSAVYTDSFVSWLGGQKSVVSLFPLMLFSVFQVVKIAIDPERFNQDYRVWWWILVVSMLTLVFNNFSGGYYLSLRNLFFSFPFFVLGLFLLAFYAMNKALKNRNFSLVLHATLLSMISLSVGRDVMLALGLVEGVNYISGLVGMMAIVVVAVVFQAGIGRYYSKLASFNNELRDKLAQQKSTLESEYRKNIILVRSNEAAAERAKLQNELHDGVLGYLSIVNAITDGLDDMSNQSINKLSRNATNEIRLILQSSEVGGGFGELLPALTYLKSQIVDPLELLGIRVRWRMGMLSGLKANSVEAQFQVVRIFQECIHNAVVRGSCRSLRVGASKGVDGVFRISISNVGGNVYDSDNIRGLGIQNMIRRAEAMGASWAIRPIVGGARVTFTLNGFD